MTCQTDKFNPAGSSTSTDRLSTLTDVVNIRDCNLELLKNVPVSGSQARYVVSATSNQNLCVTTDYNTGSGRFQVVVGDYNIGNSNCVTRIVAGPGIYISPSNGQGVVTISLQPFRQPEVDDGWDDITWSISDLGNPNKSDQSAFIVVGGTGGLNAGDGLALRSRDGDNWVELNNRAPAAVGLLRVQAVQSSDIPGSGLAYWCPNNLVNTSTVQRIGLETYWGIEGRTTATTNSWWGDDLVYKGPNLSLDGASDIYDSGHSFQNLFYKSGDLLAVGSNSVLLSFGGRSTTYGVTTASIYYHNAWPLDYNPSSTNFITVQQEAGIEDFGFQDATSNLDESTWSNWTILACGRYFGAGNLNNNRIYKSDRTNGATGTWTQVYNVLDASDMFSIAYGNGVWIACGEDDSIWTSTDTTTWTLKTSKRPGSVWRKIRYGAGRFVMVGDGGRISFSTDNGASWQFADSGTTADLKSVAYSPKLRKFVAVGDRRTIVTVKV